MHLALLMISTISAYMLYLLQQNLCVAFAFAQTAFILKDTFSKENKIYLILSNYEASFNEMF
jgi:hypothetical protein